MSATASTIQSTFSHTEKETEWPNIADGSKPTNQTTNKQVGLFLLLAARVSYLSRSGIAPDPLSKNTDFAPPTTHCKTEQNAIHIF